MKIAVCPGSYDPVTKGHVNIIERAAKVFTKVIVVVLVNPSKKATFSTAEKMDMLQKATAHILNVVVDSHDGLVAEYAKTHNAAALVKGLRAVTDFDYEFQMALINKKLNPELETLFITAEENFMYLSSSAVREIARFSGDLSEFVPDSVQEFVITRLRTKDKEK